MEEKWLSGFKKRAEAAFYTPKYNPQLVNMMKTLAFFLALITGSLAIDFFYERYLGGLLNLKYITPFAITALTEEQWYSVAFTCVAVVFAYICAIVSGHCLGTIAAVLSLSGRKRFRILGVLTSQVFNFFYIVPLVLTLSLALAVLVRLSTNEGLARELVAVGSIAVAGLVLGGYQIFTAVYSSAVSPNDKNRLLVDSLYTPHAKGWLRYIDRLRKSFIRARRLRDCNIALYKEAMERAFHLSIVAVVILETIRPQLYEMIFPQPGIVQQRFGGVGQLILTAQNNTAYETIIGVVWAIFLFDFLLLTFISLWATRKWLRFYARHAE